MGSVKYKKRRIKMKKASVIGIVIMAMCMAVSVCYAGESSYGSLIKTTTSIGEGAHSFTSVEKAVSHLAVIGGGASSAKFTSKSGGGYGTASLISTGRSGYGSARLVAIGSGSGRLSLKSANQPTEEQLAAWKAWQAEDESHAGVGYSEYKMYQRYKNTLTFDEFQQYKKDAGFGDRKSSSGFGLMICKMSADQWKAWKAWQAEDESHAGVGYTESKMYQRYKDTLTFEEFQQYTKDAGFGNWKSSDYNSFAIIKMTAGQWKAWKAWQAEDESHAGVGYTEYKGYQRYKDTMSFEEYLQYKEDMKFTQKHYFTDLGNGSDAGYGSAFTGW